MREALNVCEEPDGPYMYADALKEDIRRLDAIRESGSYARFGEEINAYAKAFPKLAAARKFEGSVEKKSSCRISGTR